MGMSNLVQTHVISLALIWQLTACTFEPTPFEIGLTAYEAEDYKSADAQWRLAGSDGDASAQNGVGWILEKGLNGSTDALRAVNWYQKAAQQKHDGAILNLGNLYDNGIGVDQDYKAAAKLFEDAAILGNAEAQNNLGRMYSEGHGVSKDQGKAVAWLERAAQQGFVPAQNSLGLHYFRGHGVPQNAEEALFWLELATQAGQEGAEHNRDFAKTFVDAKKFIDIERDVARWHPRIE